MTPAARGALAVEAAWAELGEYWAGERSRQAATPLAYDPTCDVYDAMHSVLEHGRLELGLVLSVADVERLAWAGSDAWFNEMRKIAEGG